MANLFQSWSYPAAVGWSPAARMDASWLGEAGAQQQKAEPSKGLFARLNDLLRRLRSGGNEAPAWLASLGASQGGYSSHKPDRGEDKNAAIQPVWATVPSWDGHARKSLWGSWQ